MKTRIIGAVVALVLAIIGTFILVTYVRGADARAAAGAEFVDVYVVNESVPKGTNGQEIGEYVTATELPAISVSEDRVTDLADLEGLVSSAELLPGEQLVSARFVDPAVLAASGDVPVPDGMQEVTVALEVQRVVGGVVRPGSTVGFVVTNELEPAVTADGALTTIPATRFVLHKVLVTRVQAGSSFVPEDAEASATAVQTIMVTFALTTPNVEKVVWAREMQENDAAGVWLTLEPPTADESGSQLVTPDNILP
jgi:Flp pilus assembly protein CpaB